jgi:2-polyprenyl-6-methoxyphenol hydroxylase-like FAD-dependent oxidoreductase
MNCAKHQESHQESAEMALQKVI